MKGTLFTPQLKKKRAHCCSVKNCDAKSNVNLDLSFHFFPQPKRGSVSITNYFGNLDKVDVLFASKKLHTKIKAVKTNMRVCSRHFTRHDFFVLDKKIF